MNWNISAWSIRRPVPSLVLFMVLIALGYVSFNQLPVTRFPNIDVPIVQVRVYQSGAAPAELETQVTKKIEDAIAGVNGIKHITSTLTEGQSLTVVEFRLEINPDRALNDVKDAIARVRSELPRTIEEPIVQRFEIEGLPILTYSAKAPAKTIEELSWFVDDTIVRAVQGVKGVSQIQRIGGAEREIRISLDPERLLAFGITAGDVNRQVRATNVDLAGGRGEIAGREQAIRTLAGKQSVDELAGTMIALPKGRKIRLDQLGTVTDTVQERRTFASVDGEPVVAFAISRGRGASDTVVYAAVEKVLAKIRAEHPGVGIRLVDTTTIYTQGAYDSTMTSMIEGAILAILVIIVFLRDWRATLIAAIALPLSMIPAFWVMDALGFSLNLVSLLALTIVTGILVDDAIVEIENIVRHMRMGKSAYRAALEAADEIGLAVIAITFTIIAVFAPVSFMGGIAGQYFKQFGLVVAAAVFFSLLVARLVTPMLAAYFMRDTQHVEKEGRLLRMYTRLVHWSVVHRFKTVAMGLLIFAASIGSFYLIPSGFLPPEDSGRTLLAIELPPGSLIEDTERITKQVEALVRKRPEVQSVLVNGGTLLGSGSEVRKATLTINMLPKEKRKLTQAAIKEILARELAEIPDIRFWYLQDNGQRQFSVVVTGRDGAAVTKVAAELTGQTRQLTGKDGVPLLANVVSTAELDRPELIVTPKTDLAAELGVTTDVISEAVRIATIGDIGAEPRQVRHRRPADPDPRATRLKGARQQGHPRSAEGADNERRRGAALGGRHVRDQPGPDLDRPLRPAAARADRRRSRRNDTTRRRARRRAQAAGGAKPSVRSRGTPVRRRRDHGRGVREFRQGHGRRPDDGVRGAGAAVRIVPASGDDPVLAAAVDRRGHRRAGDRRDADEPARRDRHPDADGHRDEERDHAGRFRHRGDPSWRAAARGDRRRRPQAGASDHHDDDRDGRRHAAVGARLGIGRRVPGPDGRGRDRRTDLVDGAVARLRAGRVHGHGRLRAAGVAHLRPGGWPD